MTTSEPDERAIGALRDVLPRGADVQIASSAAGSRADVLVGGRPIEIKWVGEGSLGGVRRRLASWAIIPDVVVGRQLSPGARELLSDAGIGWIDESGAAEIALGSILISRTGRPPERVKKPRGWTASVLAVAEALLCGTRGTVADMETATGLSTGTCTNALRTLTDLGLVESAAARGRGSARHVADQRALLDSYSVAATALRPTIELQVGVTWRDPVDGLVALRRRWASEVSRWVATGPVAASVLAPFLGTVGRADVYVDTATVLGLEAAAAAIDLKPIEGGRLTLRPYPTVVVDRLAETVDGLRVAPWPRVYTDLLTAGVRGEEAAEHLWEVAGAR